MGHGAWGIGHHTNLKQKGDRRVGAGFPRPCADFNVTLLNLGSRSLNWGCRLLIRGSRLLNSGQLRG